MSEVTYQDLLHDTAIRLNALVGTQKAIITATYNTAALTDANFKSADWPFGAFRDAILMAVADYAWAIADTGSHPWRAALSSLTPVLSGGDALPGTVTITDPDTLAEIERQVIGVWGAVTDVGNSQPLTEQPLDLIRRVVLSDWRTYDVYWFKFDGGHIFHTRPSVLIECCAYSQAEQLAAFEANETIPLPDVLRPAIAARAVSLLTKDGAFADQAGIYKTYSDEALTRIRGGLTTLPAKTLPTPTIGPT